MNRICESYIHHFNPTVAKGVAVAQMENALDYIDNIIRLSAQSFPEGLTYEGYKRCTVQEDLAYRTAKKQQHHTVELARSDIYMVNFYFKYKGEPLPPKPIFVPYLNKGGMIYLRGKKFTVVPVLADETISVSKDSIFVPFLSAKATFFTSTISLCIDGQVSLQNYVWSKVHNHNVNKQPRRNQRADESVNCNSCMALYLFCKYGLFETFSRFCNGVVPIITTGHVDRNKYPVEQYTLFESNGINSRGSKTRGLRSTNIKILIEKNRINTGVLGMVAGLYLILDNFPHRFSPEVFDGSADEIRLWRVILGYIIFKSKDGEGDLYSKINDHFDSLDQYIDDTTRITLAQCGYPVNDFYELIALLIAEFSTIVMKADPTTMFGKMLAVQRYVLSDLVKAISIFRYKVTGIKNRELTYADINKSLNKYFKPEVISNTLNNHNEVISAPCSSDNIMFNHTSRLILQENASKTKSTQASFKDASKLLHISIAVAGSILFLPKSEPTGRTVLNPYLPIDSTCKIKCPPHLKEYVDYLQTQIRRA